MIIFLTIAIILRNYIVELGEKLGTIPLTCPEALCPQVLAAGHGRRSFLQSPRPCVPGSVPASSGPQVSGPLDAGTRGRGDPLTQGPLDPEDW